MKLAPGLLCLLIRITSMLIKKLFLLLVLVLAVSCSSSLTNLEDEGELVTGAPVDIPVPLAKAINGVNATTIHFTPTPESETVTGILAGNLIETGDDRIVGMVVNNSFEAFVTTSDEFEFNITEDLINQPLALVVLGNTSTEDDIRTVSYPVIATVIPPDDIFDDYQTKVEITNTNENTMGLVANGNPALCEDGSVNFTGSDADSNPFMAVLNIEGSSSEILTTDLASELSILSCDINGNVYGADTNDHLVRITPEGEVLTETEDWGDAATPHVFRVSPDGNWVASSISDPDSEENSKIVNLARSDTLGPGIRIRTDDPITITFLDVAWLDNNTLAVLKRFSLPDPFPEATIQVYDVTSLVATDGSEDDVVLSPETIVISSSGLASLESNPNDPNLILYGCGDVADICMYNRETDTQTALLTPDTYLVLVGRFMADSENVIFEADVEETGEDDRSTHVIGIYNLETEETTLIGQGLNPVPSTTDADLAVYETYTDDDVIQIGVLNISYYGF